MTNLNPLSPTIKSPIQLLFVVFVFFLPLSLLNAQEGFFLSGIAESRVGTLLNTGEAWEFGAEQYGNFRISTPVGERGKLYASFNVLATSNPDTGIDTQGELERLYTVLTFDTVDLSLGLMRIPFGYGTGFRPTDIINPQNPLFPDSRLRGVLASLIAWYPRDDLQIRGFAVQRSNDYFGGQSISIYGESLFGFSVDQHNSFFSIQGLVLTTIPANEADESLFHFGISLKFDVGVGLAFDALVTTDGSTGFAEGRDNAAFTAAFGCDYSIHGGKLFFLAQYLYTSAGILSSKESVSDLLEEGGAGSGELSSLSYQTSGVNFIRRHYGYLSMLYNHSDYARLQFSLIVSLTDASVFPSIRHEIEPVQAVTLVSVIAVPLDQTVFGGSEKGEFGQDLSRFRCAASFSVKYRF